MLRSTLLLAACPGVWTHAAITSPAMRSNINNFYCPFCQGQQDECMNQGDATKCVPPTPCWGATEATTVAPFEWGDRRATKHPDGSYWIDQTGGTSSRPTWCPGDKVPIRYYVFTDHNGVWQWESQQASPGKEVEEAFKMITDRISVNNYVRDNVALANYFAEDGVTSIPSGSCKDGSEWSVLKNECMSGMYAETTLELPSDMPAGATVLRWRWFGSTDTSGHVVNGNAERSLFVNCKDVIIGTPETCANRAGMAV